VNGLSRFFGIQGPGRKDPDTACVGYRSYKLWIRDPGHSRQQDWILTFEKVCKAR
jgi:hypothetical protein